MAQERTLMKHAELIDVAPPEAVQALAFAFFTLHDMLVDSDVIAPGAAAAALRCGVTDNPKLAGFLQALATELADRQYRRACNGLRVIEGGAPPN